MTYKNRELVRKPAGMLRVNSIEQEDLDFLVDYYGGGQQAAGAPETRNAARPPIAVQQRASANAKFAPRDQNGSSSPSSGGASTTLISKSTLHLELDRKTAASAGR